MQSLKTLSNQALEVRLKDLVSRELKLLHIILEHITEVDTRRLYLERAYSSLYEYLIKECGYSGSGAMRRIEAARLLRDVSVVSEKIAEGSLNLSQIGELSRAIKEKERTEGSKVTNSQKAALVNLISGKTTQETQKELAVALDIELKPPEKQTVQKDESVNLQHTLSKEQHRKLMACKDLMAPALQLQKDSSLSSVIEVLTDDFLKRNAPKALSQDHDSGQRESTNDVDLKAFAGSIFGEKQKLNNKASVNGKGTISEEKVATSMDKNSVTSALVQRRVNKTLTPKTRKAILARDGCCQYRDLETGKKCGGTYGLQVDHRTSKWAGGNNDPANLQVLCSQHNNLKYKKESGIKSH